MNLPNKLTLSRILLVPFFMVFIIPIPEWVVNADLLNSLTSEMKSFNNFINNYGSYFAAIIFIIASSTDGVDGYIARKTKQVTKLGKFLDPIADKLLVTAALIALVSNNTISGWSAMVIIGREFIVTGLRLIAAGEGIVISASKLGKVKMVSQTIAISLALLENFPFTYITDFPIDTYVMFIAVVITAYSGVDYILKNGKVISEN
ncbi:MAG: CDP-diacylglycerol--glycerol-3-phosphate 3-phosphatidyltransferase [Clostridiales bacterium]